MIEGVPLFWEAWGSATGMEKHEDSYLFLIWINATGTDHRNITKILTLIKEFLSAMSHRPHSQRILVCWFAPQYFAEKSTTQLFISIRNKNEVVQVDVTTQKLTIPGLSLEM